MSISLIVSVIQAVTALAPDIPELVQAVDIAIDLVKSGREPTADEKARIDAGLDAAHQALQNS